MDNVRQKSWFSITAYVITSLSILMILFIFAETYFPSQSSNLIPLQNDRISRWLFNDSRWQQSRQADASNNSKQVKLFLLLNQKQSVGKTELIYRGLVGRSEFQIDVIILELDPQVSYPYRFKIPQARNAMRMGNRSYQLIAANKGSLHIKQINPQ